MDVFLEKIVKKRATAVDIAINLLLVVAAIILFLVIAVFATAYLGALGIFIGFAELYGAWYLLSSRSLEYEYSLTNGELDVDCIIAQRKRKKLASLNCREFEIIAPVNNEHKREIEAPGIKNKIFAVSHPQSEGQYFGIFNDTEKGRTLLVFEPDERMIESFKTYIPRKVMDK
ncbi:MAG: hypothetical protein E7480_02860 [Ruminococcaceae bacterium]|nr:hypothetical protein [Oscillospiraceae bacterium]